jgi:polyhydroxyalkanoate synthesis regulator phasin
MFEQFARLRQALDEAKRLGLPTGNTQDAAESGIGRAIGAVRSFGTPVRGGEIPQESNIPGLPSPGRSAAGSLDYQQYTAERNRRLADAESRLAAEPETSRIGQPSPDRGSARSFNYQQYLAERNIVSSQQGELQNALATPLARVTPPNIGTASSKIGSTEVLVENPIQSPTRPANEVLGNRGTQRLPGWSVPDGQVQVTPSGSRLSDFQQDGPTTEEESRRRTRELFRDSKLEMDVEVMGDPGLRQRLTEISPEGTLVNVRSGQRGGTIGLTQEKDLKAEDELYDIDPSGVRYEEGNPRLGLRNAQASPKYGILPRAHNPASLLNSQRRDKAGKQEWMATQQNRWTEGTEDNIKTTVEVPYVDDNGNYYMMSVDPSVEISPGKTLGSVLAGVRSDFKTPVATAQALNDKVQQRGWGFADRSGKAGTLKGTLYPPGETDPNRATKVYDPELGPLGRPLESNQEVPDGMYGTRTKTNKLYRLGNAQGNDYTAVGNQLRELDAEQRAKTGTGLLPTYDASRAPKPQPIVDDAKKVHPANLEQLESWGGRFGVPSTDETGRPSIQWVNNWQEAASTGDMFYRQSRGNNAPVERVFNVRQPDGSTAMYLGTPEFSGTLRPAFLSDEYEVRTGAEKWSGIKPGEQLATLINSGVARGEIGTATGANVLEDLVRRQAAAKGVPPEVIESALLEAARTRTSREETQQGIRQRRSSREVDLFNEADINQMDPLPTGIGVWRAEQGMPRPRMGIDPELDQPISSGARMGTQPNPVDADMGSNPYVMQALYDEQQMLLEKQRLAGNDTYSDIDADGSSYRGRSERDFQATGRIADAIESSVARDFTGGLPSSDVAAAIATLELQKYPWRQAGINPGGQLTAERVAALADTLTGGTRDPMDNPQARRLAQIVLENTAPVRDGGMVDPADLARNLNDVAALNPDFVEYALNQIGDRNFSRAASVVEAAQSSVAPRAAGQNVDPIDVLNAIDTLTGGGQIGTGYDSFSTGKKVAYNKLGQRYQQPGYGNIRNYDAYAQALGGELGEELLGKAMQRAAVRLAEMRGG